MRFRITLFIFLIIYIFSGVFLGYFQSTDDSISFKDIQEQILIDENELNVFDKKSLENINVTEKILNPKGEVIEERKPNYLNSNISGENIIKWTKKDFSCWEWPHVKYSISYLDENYKIKDLFFSTGPRTEKDLMISGLLENISKSDSIIKLIDIENNL